MFVYVCNFMSNVHVELEGLNYHFERNETFYRCNKSSSLISNKGQNAQLKFNYFLINYIHT